MSIPHSWRACSACRSKHDIEKVDGRWLCFDCRCIEQGQLSLQALQAKLPTRRPALPVDAAFARAVLERVLAYRTEETRKRPNNEHAALEADHATLQRIIGALEAMLPDREVNELEQRVRAFDYEPSPPPVVVSHSRFSPADMDAFRGRK